MLFCKFFWLTFKKGFGLLSHCTETSFQDFTKTGFEHLRGSTFKKYRSHTRAPFFWDFSWFQPPWQPKIECIFSLTFKNAFSCLIKSSSYSSKWTSLIEANFALHSIFHIEFGQPLICTLKLKRSSISYIQFGLH